jgi:hypothetical protein
VNLVPMANVLAQNLKALRNARKRLAHKIGNFQARVLLTVLYAIVVLPSGLIARLFSNPLKITIAPRNGLAGSGESPDQEAGLIFVAPNEFSN